MAEKKLMSSCIWANKLDNIRVDITRYYLATVKGKGDTKALEYDELKNILYDLILERKTIDEIAKEWEKKVEDTKYYTEVKKEG